MTVSPDAALNRTPVPGRRVGYLDAPLAFDFTKSVPDAELPPAVGGGLVLPGRRPSASDVAPSSPEIILPERSREKVPPAAAPAELPPENPPPFEDTAKGVVGRRLFQLLDGFSRKKQVQPSAEVSPSLWSEAKKRLKNAPRQGWQILKEFVKSKHPYVSMGLGIAGTAALGIVSPELAQKFIAHSGEIRTVAAMSALGLATIESVIDRESRFGKACKVARLIASDVALASMVSPLGAGLGEWGHHVLSNFTISGAAADIAPTATPQAHAADHGKPTLTDTPAPAEAASPTATATPTEAPPPAATATPNIQPTWEVGHPPTQEQLDWAHSHGNFQNVDVDHKGGPDFAAYDLDPKHPGAEFYQRLDASGHPTGEVWWAIPDGKFVQDLTGDGKIDNWYSQPPVPADPSSGSVTLHHLASPVRFGMREGELPLPEASDITGDGKPDLFRMEDGSWRLDTDGSSFTFDSATGNYTIDKDKMLAELQVNIDSGKIISADGLTEWKFEDPNPETGTAGNWVQSDLLSPIERGVHDVNPDVTISAGEGKWHAGENYLSRILSNHSVTSYDTDLARNLSKGEGANTIAVDAVKDVLESHNVPTTVDGGGSYHVNVDPSYNQEIGARIQTTVDKINGWFTPDMDDAEKNKFLAEMSKRGLIEVKNLTVEGLDGLGKLAAALQKGS